MKYLCLLFLLNCFISPLSAQERGSSFGLSNLNFYTHSLAFGVYEDENMNIRGIKGGGRRAVDIEIIRSIMKRLGGIQPIKNVSIEEGLLKTQTEKNTVFFNIIKLPEREDLFNWVGPLEPLTAFFYGPKNIAPQVKTLEDAKNFESICILKGGARSERYKKAGFENLVEVSSKYICLDMLKEGRVDLFAMTGIDEKLFADYELDKDFAKSEFQEFRYGYIAFSKDIEYEVIRAWQEALNYLKSSGEYDRIVQEYGLK